MQSLARYVHVWHTGCGTPHKARRSGGRQYASKSSRMSVMKGATILKIKLVIAILVGIMGIALGTAAAAADISLYDPDLPNSRVNINTQTGITGWIVELRNQMPENSYWYRIGQTGVASPLSALDVSETHSATVATVAYTCADFEIDITYSLTGGDIGCGTSDLYQSVKVINKRQSSLDFNLFEYVNFDLNGTAPLETAAHTDSSHIDQNEGATWAQLGVMGTKTTPSHWEIGNAGTLRDKISAASDVVLSDSQSPYTGDTGFAAQWFRTLDKGGSFMFGQDLLVGDVNVPEPSSMMALIGALGLFPALRRRRH